MIKTRKDYQKYLKEYKTENYKNVPASEDDYIKWWEEAIETDLREFEVLDSSFTMHFHPYQKDGPLLVLDKKGNLPEKYQRKFEAYQVYGANLNMLVDVEYKELDDGGKIYYITVTGENSL